MLHINTRKILGNNKLFLLSAFAFGLLFLAGPKAKAANFVWPSNPPCQLIGTTTFDFCTTTFDLPAGYTITNVSGSGFVSGGAQGTAYFTLCGLDPSGVTTVCQSVIRFQTPGWNYNDNVGSNPNWTSAELTIASEETVQIQGTLTVSYSGPVAIINAPKICGDPSATNFLGNAPCQYPTGFSGSSFVVCYDPIRGVTDVNCAVPWGTGSINIGFDCAPPGSHMTIYDGADVVADGDSSQNGAFGPVSAPLNGPVTVFSNFCDTGNSQAVVRWQSPSGTIDVSSNVVTSWVVSGGSGPYNGINQLNATYSQATTGSPVQPAAYSISGSALSGYVGPVINSSPQALADGGTINFTLTYLNKPTNLQADTLTDCGKIKLSWSDSNNETGYVVYRSTDPVNGYVKISKNLPANTTSYTDPTAGQPGAAPSQNTTYYYQVHAFNAIGQDASTSTTQAITPQCKANLSNSSKFIYKINNAFYNNSMAIPNGATVTFRITINNSGTEGGVISDITDTLSSNLINPRNAKVDKGNGFAATGIVGAVPNITIKLNGTIPKGGSWVVEFDTTANLPPGVDSLVQNKETTNCTSQFSGINCSIDKKATHVAPSSSSGVKFNEVSP